MLIRVRQYGVAVPLRNPEQGEIEIWTANDLASIGADANYPLDGNYIQMADLDLSCYAPDNPDLEAMDIGDYWYPIGYPFDSGSRLDRDSEFSGKYDGNGFFIRNLAIKNRMDMDYQGLFGSISDKAVLSNIGIESVDIAAKYMVGALVGHNKGTVINCHATGYVRGRCRVGGLVGQNSGTIDNCYFAGAVTGNNRTGGLVGVNDYGTIRSSFCQGDVVGQYKIGSLVGLNHAGCSIISCSTTCNVKGNGYINLIAGINEGCIELSKADGYVTAEN